MSAKRGSTFSYGTDKASAAIWQRTVTVPAPTSMRPLTSRVPGLVVVNGEGEEVVRWVGSGRVVFVAQVQDARLPSGAHLPSESWGAPQRRQYQQATGQQRHRSARGGLQPVGGGNRAPAQLEALFAVPEVLLRLHPLPVHPHRHAVKAGVGQKAKSATDGLLPLVMGVGQFNPPGPRQHRDGRGATLQNGGGEQGRPRIRYGVTLLARRVARSCGSASFGKAAMW